MTEAALRARIADLEAVLRLFVAYDENDHDDDLAMMLDYNDAITAARAALSSAVPKPPPPPPHLREREVWTPERLSLLASMAPTKPLEVVLACLNDLPGVPIASVEAVRLRYALERSRGAA
jgi:hypothetical protein